LATPTYTPIASITLGSSASSVTFSSIPQDYRDLVLVINGGASAAATIEFQFNGDTTGSNYSQVNMIGDGSSATSSAQSDRNFIYFDSANSISILEIMDYSATDKHKTTLTRDNTLAQVSAKASRYASTTAITSIKFQDAGGATLDSGTTLALYGIAS